MRILASLSLIFVKLCVHNFTNTFVHNAEPFRDLLFSGHLVSSSESFSAAVDGAKKASDHPRGRRPILTIANHTCSIDDPFIWGAIFSTVDSFRLANLPILRHTVGAREILYTSRFKSWFFKTVQVIPIIRGNGVRQAGVDECIQILRDGGWVHIFPEGRAYNDSYRDIGRLKWGIGRMIAETRPILVPIRHYGLDAFNEDTTRKTWFRPRIDVVVGEPIDTANFAVTSGTGEEHQWSELTRQAAAALKAIKAPV